MLERETGFEPATSTLARWRPNDPTSNEINSSDPGSEQACTNACTSEAKNSDPTDFQRLISSLGRLSAEERERLAGILLGEEDPENG